MKKYWMGMAGVVMAAVLVSLGCSSAAADEKMSGIYTGTVESIDLKARALHIKNETFHMSFEVAKDARICTKEKETASLRDIRTGDEVRVDFIIKRGVNVAHQIAPKYEPTAMQATR